MAERTIRGFDYLISGPLILSKWIFLCTRRRRGIMPLKWHVGGAASRENSLLDKNTKIKKGSRSMEKRLFTS
ncbi:MAG: hypothetical protein NC313_16995, partial [Butyrivibrio sp.]|nr:hypothetical protein [Butyrivibrio sp.]